MDWKSPMFVLAHLSDPHLAPLPRPRPLELMSKRGLGYINWLRKRRSIHRAEMLAALVADLKAHAPDHIAVTGDLVNLSLTNEFAPARAWLDGLGDPRDVTVVPGNHDAYVRPAADFAERHWGDFMRGDDGESFPFVRRRGPLALIGLSTSLPTLPLAATGRLHGDQLARLGELLAKLKREQVFRVVLIHHPPIEGAQLFPPADQCRRAARCAARARRRAGAARPSPRGVAALAAGPADRAFRWSACRRPRARRAAMTSRPATISMRSRAPGARGAARWFRAAGATAASARSTASRCSRNAS